MPVIPGTTVDFTLSPRVIRIPPEITEVSVYDLHQTLLDIEDSEAGITFPKLRDTSGGQDLGGGVLVGWTTQLNNAVIFFPPRSTPIETGTATANDANGKILTDGAAGFIAAGATLGSIIINWTTRAITIVTEVISATELRHVQLSGGSRTTWLIGDEYSLYDNLQCRLVGGNFTAVDDAQQSIEPTLPSFGTQIVRTSASSATAISQPLLEYASFNGGVTIDVLSGYSGTEFPVGTPQQPVNNLTDAHTIAMNRGFTTFYVIGDLTIDSGTHTGHTFIGASPTRTTITIAPEAEITGVEFLDAKITGTLDGNSRAVGCWIDDLSYISGFIEQCVLSGTIELGGIDTAHFLDCWTGAPGTVEAIIDLGGAVGPGCIIRNLNGWVKLINRSNVAETSIDLSSGVVELDATLVSGSFAIRGVGRCINNAGVGATVNTSLLNADTLELVRKLLQNRNQTNPVTGRHEFFDDNGDALMSGQIWEDVAGTIPYGPESTKIQRRDKLAV